MTSVLSVQAVASSPLLDLLVKTTAWDTFDPRPTHSHRPRGATIGLIVLVALRIPHTGRSEPGKNGNSKDR